MDRKEDDPATASASLPALLHRLGQGDLFEPAFLRPHQHHAWHAFLVQLAALVLDRTGSSTLDLSAEEWQEGLLELAGETAWQLVTEDLSKPAFLQPPVPEGTLDSFKKVIETPDELDVVITTRNHDVKQERMRAPAAEHWVYSLVTLQTMEGFLGRGNYGIARMNGGFGSRPAVTAAPGPGWSERFRRDVGLWLERRETLIEGHGYRESGGHALLWLLPWDGTTSYPLDGCDPFFIEICRRIRLQETQGRIVARAAPTKASLLAAKELSGDTGDVWTPVSAEGKALTVSESGFSYKLMRELLFGGYAEQPALRLREEDGKEPIFLAQVLVRGQGTTGGYHERRIPIPPKIRRMLGRSSTDNPLAGLSKARVDQVRTAQKSVLKPAILTWLQGGPDRLDFQDRRAQPWLDRLDRAVDRVFFEDLWADAELPTGEAERRWQRRLLDFAETVFEEALEEAPSPTARAPRARARAELVFRGAARNHLTNATLSEENNPSVEETP